MKMLEVTAMLEELRAAREKWGRARTEFFSGYDWVLTRLVHEGAANYMGAEQMANALGVGTKTIRGKMRSIGLDPRAGKRTLNAKASEALMENSAIMGIEPADMDLTSPLAYLPMGEEMRKIYQDRTLARVTEIPTDNGEMVTGYTSLSEAVHDLHLRGGRLRYACPTCGLLGDEVLGNAVSGNVSVPLEDLRVVLDSCDYMAKRSLIGPVDRLSDIVALATLKDSE